MTPLEIQQRLEDAGRTLMMLPIPRNGVPGQYRSWWPDTVSTRSEWFAAQVQADAEIREEMLAGRNAVKLLPQQHQIDDMQEALEWIYDYLYDPFKKIAFARMLVHPVSGRHIVSFRKLGRITGLDHKTVKARHDVAMESISCALAKKSSPFSPKYGMAMTN